MSRYARKVDDNHRAIVKALKQVGCSVLSLAAVGNGCPDLLVMRAGKFFMMEIKDGAKTASRRKLTPKQQAFKRTWPVHLVLEPLDALRVVGLSSPRAQVERMAATTYAKIRATLEANGVESE